jgi:hypothetical protein
MGEIRSGSIGDLTTPRDFGNNCLNAFLDEIADDITGACMVPVNLPQREIISIIKRAKKWFYKKYEYAVRENYYHIPKEVFSSEYFKAYRALYLPGPDPVKGGGEVYSVFGLWDISSGWQGASGGLDLRFSGGNDFAIDKLLFRNAYQGSGPANFAEELQYYVVNASLFDLARQILENPISFAYSQLTGELKFMGDTPKGDVVLHVYETIEDCALYNDEIFFRYVSAKIKQSIGTKLGIFKFALPGNVDFDYDAIKSMGDEELEAIDEEIKGDEGVDWMFHS